MKQSKYPAYGLRSTAKTSVNGAVKAEAHMPPTAAVVVAAFMVQMFGMICIVRWTMETLGIRQYQEKALKMRTMQPAPNSNICLTHHRNSQGPIAIRTAEPRQQKCLPSQVCFYIQVRSSTEHLPPRGCIRVFQRRTMRTWNSAWFVSVMALDHWSWITTCVGKNWLSAIGLRLFLGDLVRRPPDAFFLHTPVAHLLEVIPFF